MRIALKKLVGVLLSSASLVLCCEYAIYYLVLFKCSWPALKINSTGSEENSLKAMFLADTHLVGPVHGHWFDKLRREWQMHRSFQTAIQLFQPEIVFFLGDIFDEGQLVSLPYFNRYVERFRDLFAVPASTKTFIIVGNHDIGFHYRITPSLKKRFEDAFNSSAVRRIRLKDVNFILVNSMAMEGDGCFLCKPAAKKIYKIAGDLQCERDGKEGCSSKVKSFSSPILLQHFPLYRKSDESCVGDDSAPDVEKEMTFRENIDCVSASSSQILLRKLEPRLILSGHTHHGCLYHHEVVYERGVSISKVPEYSVPSFSWRNRDNPSFLLGQFSSDAYEISKCKLPRETTVTLLYSYGAMIIILRLLGYVPRLGRGRGRTLSRDLSSNLKFIGIILVSSAVYFYVHRH